MPMPNRTPIRLLPRLANSMPVKINMGPFLQAGNVGSITSDERTTLITPRAQQPGRDQIVAMEAQRRHRARQQEMPRRRVKAVRLELEEELERQPTSS